MDQQMPEPPLPAVQLIRLLASTIEVVADGWDTLADEPAMKDAVRSAADVLQSLSPDADPDATFNALQTLGTMVAHLPDPWDG